MSKPFCTCPTHGWTERTESGGPCKKCVEESAPVNKGAIGGLFGLAVRVSEFMPDDTIIVNPFTLEKLRGWYADIQVKKSD